MDPSLFENPSEGQLDQAVQALIDAKEGRSLDQQFSALLELEPVISLYFEENMIMDKDEAVKNNRLSLLTILADQTAAFGNLDQLIVK